MKLMDWLWWETVGEKEEFAKILEESEGMLALQRITERFGLGFTDAQRAIDVFKEHVLPKMKKNGN